MQAVKGLRDNLIYHWEPFIRMCGDQKTVATTLLAVRNFKIQFMEVSLISKALS